MARQSKFRLPDPVDSAWASLLPAERPDAEKTLRETYSIPGFREGWLERFIRNAPCHTAARVGYLAALYALRAEGYPAAYVRQPDTAKFQAAVDCAIAYLEPQSPEVAS